MKKRAAKHHFLSKIKQLESQNQQLWLPVQGLYKNGGENSQELAGKGH